MKKIEANDTLKISTKFLKQHQYFSSIWKNGVVTWTTENGFWKNVNRVGIEVSFIDDENYLRLKYTSTDNTTSEKKNFDYQIPIISTPCRYGGDRYWFICPWYKNKKYCGRRVNIIYKSGDYFACRHCNNLTYKSRNINRRGRTSHLFNFLDLDDKASELAQQIKHPYYRGKPTRKQKRLERIYQKIESASNKLKLI